MLFEKTNVEGAVVIAPELHRDERGFFARTWCTNEFRDHGLNPKLVQCSLSFNPKKGTLRGMHYQAEPTPETKLVRCTRGALYDVVLDLRRNSATYLKWAAIELTAENHRGLYIPEGCAHGFVTMESDTEAFYQMSEFYYADGARGVRWNDPAFGIIWPLDVEVISDRDRTYPDFESA